jgi:hypothetical protein
MTRKANINVRLLDSEMTIGYNVLLNVTDESLLDDDSEGFDLEHAVAEALDPHMERFDVSEPFEVWRVIFEGEPRFEDFTAEDVAAELTV